MKVNEGRSGGAAGELDLDPGRRVLVKGHSMDEVSTSVRIAVRGVAMDARRDVWETSENGSPTTRHNRSQGYENHRRTQIRSHEARHWWVPTPCNKNAEYKGKTSTNLNGKAEHPRQRRAAADPSWARRPGEVEEVKPDRHTNKEENQHS